MSMLKNVVTTPLLDSCPELVLHKIEKEQRLSELEFYFCLDRISKQSIGELLTRHGVNERVVKRLEFQEIEGFLKGFIDLVFEYDGQYYLVDWKSNFLGRRVEDYRSNVLTNVMIEESYILQYLLYTVALHQYLTVRMPEYQYEKDFGGVFYLFLRGMNPEYGPGYGVYHDIPSADLVTEMTSLLACTDKS
jgi:exodeoxyribonuclease V beta subunit